LRNDLKQIGHSAIIHASNAASSVFATANRTIFSEIWIATLDGRLCPICAALHKRRFSADEGPFPPRHPNCLPGDSRVSTSDRIASVSKRWFEGNFVVIQSADGHELSCTPNHPILTDRGWVAAQKLDLGSKIICERDKSSVGSVAAQDETGNYVPSRIEDVAKAFFGSSEMSSVTVPTAAEDFHGDGIDGEVAVIGADRRLLIDDETALSQEESQSEFVSGDSDLFNFSRFRNLTAMFKRMLGAANSFMSGGNLMLSLPCGHSVPFESFSFALSTSDDAGIDQSTSDNISSDGIFLSDPVLGHSGNIVIDGIPGDCKFSHVTSKEEIPFSGYVYNMQTENGQYLANGIVTHNCRCVRTPFFKAGGTFASPDFDDWLRGEPVEVADQVLGKTRSKLFRDGKLKVERFVDNPLRRTNPTRILTLEELRASDSRTIQEAFKKAGLES
jgi:hypothetical protein